MEQLLCPWDAATYLIFSENVPSLLYYSHFIAVLSSLIVGLYIFFRNKSDPTSRALILLFSVFSIWTIVDVAIWATNSPDFVMFWWSIIILLEPIIYVTAFYVCYLFFYQKYPNFKTNLFVAGGILPLIIFLPTHFNLIGVYRDYCNAIEGPLALYYTYILEGLAILGILVSAIYAFKKTILTQERMKILYFTLGMVAFLVALSSGNVIGSITEDWDLAQYGLFGMPIFVALLAYLIVRFKTFNIKLLSTQVFIVTLWLLTLSALFVRTIGNIRFITGVNLLLAMILGYMLIRAVKREVKQREEIEDLAGRLKSVNSILSHDVKAVLGKNKDMFNALLSNDLGQIPSDAKPFLEQSYIDTNTLIDSIITILESGHELILNPSSFDLKAETQNVVASLKKDAEAKGLSIQTDFKEGGGYTILADKIQLTTHVLTNLIANAINYTLKGTILVHIERKDPATVLFSVKDTGVGITPEDKQNLFKEGGHGKDSRKVNVHSTGYGLYIAKKIVDAHGGKIWAESEGQGKGSTFVVELPVTPPPQIKKA